MRKVIPLGEHPACSLTYHQLIRSTRIVTPAGTPAEVNIYLVGAAPSRYVLAYGNRWALDGYFDSEDEAVEAWEKHAVLLRSQAVAS